MNKKTIAVLLMAAAAVLTACGTDKKGFADFPVGLG